VSSGLVIVGTVEIIVHLIVMLVLDIISILAMVLDPTMSILGA
jgi:hypothetical protein